jgi:hypothetical protein
MPASLVAYCPPPPPPNRQPDRQPPAPRGPPCRAGAGPAALRHTPHATTRHTPRLPPADYQWHYQLPAAEGALMGRPDCLLPAPLMPMWRQFPLLLLSTCILRENRALAPFALY